MLLDITIYWMFNTRCRTVPGPEFVRVHLDGAPPAHRAAAPQDAFPFGAARIGVARPSFNAPTDPIEALKRDLDAEGATDVHVEVDQVDPTRAHFRYTVPKFPIFSQPIGVQDVPPLAVAASSLVGDAIRRARVTGNPLAQELAAMLETQAKANTRWHEAMVLQEGVVSQARALLQRARQHIETSVTGDALHAEIDAFLAGLPVTSQPEPPTVEKMHAQQIADAAKYGAAMMLCPVCGTTIGHGEIEEIDGVVYHRACHAR